jgi:hypothetical protein
MKRTLTTAKQVAGSDFEPFASRDGSALLIAPPIYDVRLNWPSWHSPMGLLKLGALLKSRCVDVQLIDSLHVSRGERLPRKKIGSIYVQDLKLDRWHFGMPYSRIEKHIRLLLSKNWEPSKVFLTSLNSIWWESTRDTIALVRRMLPKASIVLGGAYPTVEPEHARFNSGADIIINGGVPSLNRYAPDISLYGSVPYSTSIAFYTSALLYPGRTIPLPRSTNAIVTEVKKKAEKGVREFVFCDQEIRLGDRDALGALLDELAKLDHDVHFVFPGNIGPRLVNRNFARKLKRARVTHIFLHCDLEFESQSIQYAAQLSEYEKCIEGLILEEVIKPRGGQIAAMLIVGLPFEDLDHVCERMVRLAHIVGSVIVVPFQYVPGLHTGPLFERALAQNGRMLPQDHNSKLFPIGRLCGKSIEDYVEVMRLATLLNSKHRSKTFDYLGNGLAAKLLRESIRSGAWNPFATSQSAPSISHSMDLAMIEERNDNPR